jgi:hypothetical protein
VQRKRGGPSQQLHFFLKIEFAYRFVDHIVDRAGWGFVAVGHAALLCLAAFYQPQIRPSKRSARLPTPTPAPSPLLITHG